MTRASPLKPVGKGAGCIRLKVLLGACSRVAGPCPTLPLTVPGKMPSRWPPTSSGSAPKRPAASGLP
jgi:hypothetical protein